MYSENDLFELARFISLNFKLFKFDFLKNKIPVPFKDYIQYRIENDLSHKFNKYEIQEMFDDKRMNMLINFITEKESHNDTKTKIH